MERQQGEEMTENAKKFHKWRLVGGFIMAALLLVGILYYAFANKVQLQRVTRNLQQRVAKGEISGQVTVGAPEGILASLQDMLAGCEVKKLGLVHPAGDARRAGCEYFLAESEVSERELQDTGYMLASRRGEYWLYKTIMEEGDWMITQYGSVSGLQSMSYALVSEDGRFILLDGGHYVDMVHLRSLIETYGDRVDLWICSHFHEDHIGAITQLLAQQGDNTQRLDYVTIQELWCPPMDIDTYKTFAKEWDSIDTCETFLSEIADLDKVTRVNTGEAKKVGNLEFLFFSAYADDAPWTHEGNNCGFIFQVKGKSETMLFCCDVGNEWISERLVSIFGDMLKSDYVQMGHHGNGGLTEEAYRIVAPKAAFFDGPAWLFQDEEKYTAAKNRRLMESMGCEIMLLDDAPNSILLK